MNAWFAGHLTPRSDVYSFGVVLLELLTGRKSLDKSRPAREQNLTEWAIPLLKEKKKQLNIVDPRLGGEYPTKGAQKAAMLAYHCLNRNPKARPLMRDIVDSIEPLLIDEHEPQGLDGLTTLTFQAEGPKLTTWLELYVEVCCIALLREFFILPQIPMSDLRHSLVGMDTSILHFGSLSCNFRCPCPIWVSESGDIVV